MLLGIEVVNGLRVKAKEAHRSLIMKDPGVCCSDCPEILREWHLVKCFKRRKDTSASLVLLGTYWRRMKRKVGRLVRTLLWSFGSEITGAA